MSAQLFCVLVLAEKILKNIPTDSLSSRAQLVPYGADDVVDESTTLLEILAGQSEDDAEFDEQEGVPGGVIATLRLHVMVAAPVIGEGGSM